MDFNLMALGAGRCVHVPEIKREAPGLKLLTLPCVEKHDFLWMRWGDPQQTGPNWFTELETGEFTYSGAKAVWNTHFSRCVENQLDYTHLPFVHARTIGKGVDPSRKVTWVFNDESLRVHLGESDIESNFFEFRFPNIWRLVIGQKMVQTLMFVPRDDDHTEIYGRAYHRFTQLPGLRELIAWTTAKFANPYILNEDRLVVLSQEPKDVRSLDLAEILFPSDKAILAFRKWLSA